MSLRHYQRLPLPKKSNQRGSMLIIALFVIIVLALLGLTMTRLLSSSSDAIIHEVLGQRALNAARSGLECSLAEHFKPDPIDPLDPIITVCAHFLSKTFSGVAGLENCNYAVPLPTSTPIVDGTKNLNYLTFTSTGQCTAGNINVTRVIYVDVML